MCIILRFKIRSSLPDPWYSWIRIGLQNQKILCTECVNVIRHLWTLAAKTMLKPQQPPIFTGYVISVTQFRLDRLHKYLNRRLNTFQ